MSKAMYRYFEDLVPNLRTRQRIAYMINNASNRCYNPNVTAWGWYAYRGIKIWWAEEYGGELTRGSTNSAPVLKWHYEMARYLAVLPGCNNPNLWLERIDNDKNYEPGNLMFTTPSEKCYNRRSSPNQSKPAWKTTRSKHIETAKREDD